MIPDVAKQIILQQIDDLVAREKEKKQPNESAQERALRGKTLDLVGSDMAALIREGQTLNAQVDIEQGSKQLKAELPEDRLHVFVFIEDCRHDALSTFFTCDLDRALHQL